MLPASRLSSAPWVMLPARLGLFLFFQAGFAAVFALNGIKDAWGQSAAWWPFTVTLANLVYLFGLVRLFHMEGKRYRDIFRIDSRHWKSDTLTLAVFFVLIVPVATLPRMALGTVLYGDELIPLRLLFAPLPLWAVYTSMVVFPLTQGLTELPGYFLYVMPRLEGLTRKPWLAYLLAGLFLGIQHAAAPLRLDATFIVWRGLMFLPFALLIGALLKWRPRLLLYAAIFHVLIDVLSGLMYLSPF